MPSSFLENSATFLGCIFTLVVLCFLFDKNNFVFNLICNILKESRDEVHNEIKDLEVKAQENYDHAEEVEKNFSRSGSSEMPKEQIEMINMNQIFSMIYQSAVFRALSLDNVMTMLKKSDEFVSSFLYTFLFCLVVFLFDELYDSSDTLLDTFCLNFVFLFSIISIYIWILKWVYFWFHIDNRKTIFSKKYHFAFFKSLGLIFGLPIIGTLLILLLQYGFKIDVSYWMCIIIYIVAIFVIGIIAICLFWNNEYRFTSFFVISHFFCILISLVLMMVSSFCLSNQTIPIDPIWARRVSLLTALLTGLIFPFIIPLCKLHIKIRKIKKENSEDMAQYGKIQNDMLKVQNKYMLEMQKLNNGKKGDI